MDRFRIWIRINSMLCRYGLTYNCTCCKPVLVHLNISTYIGTKYKKNFYPPLYWFYPSLYWFYHPHCNVIKKIYPPCKAKKFYYPHNLTKITVSFILNYRVGKKCLNNPFIYLKKYYKLMIIYTHYHNLQLNPWKEKLSYEIWRLN